MNDVIYRKDAAKIICNWCSVCPEDKRDIMNCDDICPEFSRIPSVDAVEVVRCEDCKHWVKDGNESFGYAMFCKANCSLGGQGIKKPDDFCSYGERKGDG